MTSKSDQGPDGNRDLPFPDPDPSEQMDQGPPDQGEYRSHQDIGHNAGKPPYHQPQQDKSGNHQNGTGCEPVFHLFHSIQGKDNDI